MQKVGYVQTATKHIHDYRIGVYGSFNVVEDMAFVNACQHFWQAYAWSRGKYSETPQASPYRLKLVFLCPITDFLIWLLFLYIPIKISD